MPGDRQRDQAVRAAIVLQDAKRAEDERRVAIFRNRVHGPVIGEKLPGDEGLGIGIEYEAAVIGAEQQGPVALHYGLDTFLVLDAALIVKIIILPGRRWDIVIAKMPLKFPCPYSIPLIIVKGRLELYAGSRSDLLVLPGIAPEPEHSVIVREHPHVAADILHHRAHLMQAEVAGIQRAECVVGAVPEIDSVIESAHPNIAVPVPEHFPDRFAPGHSSGLHYAFTVR